MNRQQCLNLCDKINNSSNIEDCIKALESLIKSRNCKGYFRRYAKKFLQGLVTGKPFFAIISKNGNSKLPFYAFSSLPLYSCPGAGDCVNWCYSLKAWRYPAAFFRQIQNFILMKFDQDKIVESFNQIKSNASFRLYVDGDFSSRSDVVFWFNLLKSRPDVQTYGYSKSWDLINDCKAYYPSNYSLNLSSGGKAQSTSKADMLALSITRGEFIAVKIGKLPKDKQKIRFSLPEYHQEVRTNGKALTGSNGFSCPGKCGDCASSVHACGSSKFKGIPIYIGVH